MAKSSSMYSRLPCMLYTLHASSCVRVPLAPEPVGGRVEGVGWRVEGVGWRVEGGGWRMEGGGWRVEGGVFGGRVSNPRTDAAAGFFFLIFCGGRRLCRLGWCAPFYCKLQTNKVRKFASWQGLGLCRLGWCVV